MITLGHKDGSIEKISNSRITQIVKGMPTHTVIGGEFAVVADSENIAIHIITYCGVSQYLGLSSYSKSAGLRNS